MAKSKKETAPDLSRFPRVKKDKNFVLPERLVDDAAQNEEETPDPALLRKPRIKKHEGHGQVSSQAIEANKRASFNKIHIMPSSTPSDQKIAPAQDSTSKNNQKAKKARKAAKSARKVKK